MLLLSFPTKVCICIYPSNSPSFQGVSFESFQLLLCVRGDTVTVAVGAAEGLVEDVEAALALRPLHWTWEVKYQGWGWMGMDGDGWGWMGMDGDGGSLGEKRNWPATRQVAKPIQWSIVYWTRHFIEQGFSIKTWTYSTLIVTIAEWFSE